MKSKVLLCSSLSALMLLGCGKTNNNQSSTKAIIGEDDRVVTSTYAAMVGAISTDGVKICTGFISAANQVTTAGHCVSDTNKAYVFELANGSKVKIDSLANFYPNADVAVLNAKVGSKYLPSASFDSNIKGVDLISYSAENYGLTASTNGSIESKDGILYHTLDTVHGSSGSPIIVDNKVVGVHIGYLSSQNVNVAIEIDRINSVDIKPMMAAIDNEWGIHIPNMGGTVGHALGQVTEPIKHAVTEPIANALGGVGQSAINKMAGMIADNPEVRRQSGGWTIYTCAASGGALFYSLQAGYSTPVCAALNVAAAGCVAFILSSGSAITTATCATLCQEHRLSGPECQ